MARPHHLGLDPPPTHPGHTPNPPFSFSADSWWVGRSGTGPPPSPRYLYSVRGVKCRSRVINSQHYCSWSGSAMLRSDLGGLVLGLASP